MTTDYATLAAESVCHDLAGRLTDALLDAERLRFVASDHESVLGLVQEKLAAALQHASADAACREEIVRLRGVIEEREATIDRLTVEAKDAHATCNGSCDIALARRQIGPDGYVPGNARECAEMWQHEADRRDLERLKQRTRAEQAERERDAEREAKDRPPKQPVAPAPSDVERLADSWDSESARKSTDVDHRALPLNPSLPQKSPR